MKILEAHEQDCPQAAVKRREFRQRIRKHTGWLGGTGLHELAEKRQRNAYDKS